MRVERVHIRKVTAPAAVCGVSAISSGDRFAHSVAEPDCAPDVIVGASLVPVIVMVTSCVNDEPWPSEIRTV